MRVIPHHKQEVIWIHIQQFLPVGLHLYMSLVWIYLIQPLSVGYSREPRMYLVLFLPGESMTLS